MQNNQIIIYAYRKESRVTLFQRSIKALMPFHSCSKGTTPKIIYSLILVNFILSFFTSCRMPYQSALPSYKTIYTDSCSVRPDYSQPKYWAAHPSIKDLSDSIPAPLINIKRDSVADVFFIHPTTFTKHKRSFKKTNAEIADPVINAKTDYSSILYQASVFNASCRVFAPRYRQAHIAAFFTKDTAGANKAFHTAYEDVRNAFEFYLKHENNKRPIIIASHSQGTLHAARLLKEFFEDKPLKEQLVVAYLWGMPLPPSYLGFLSVCKDPSQTGCVAGWRLYKQGYIPKKIKEEKFTSYVVNPITWRSNDQYAGSNDHKGAVLFEFNKVYKNTHGAKIKNGVVWIDKPRFPFSFLYTRRNYHAGDINLFYIDIRENISQRIKTYIFQKSQ
jgi:hypothetical protein